MPSSLSRPSSLAGTDVADCSASIGVMPGRDIELELAMQGVAEHRLIRAGDDGNAAPMRLADDLEKFLELGVAVLGVGGVDAGEVAA